MHCNRYKGIKDLSELVVDLLREVVGQGAIMEKHLVFLTCFGKLSVRVR